MFDERDYDKFDAQAPIPWLDVLEMGVAEIDADHRHLIADTNALLEAVRSGTSDADVRTRLRRMHAECVSHFRREEEVLERSGFPGLEAHRAEHARVERMIENILMRLEAANEQEERRRDLCLEFRSALINHLLYYLYYDLRYKSHLMNERGE